MDNKKSFNVNSNDFAFHIRRRCPLGISGNVINQYKASNDIELNCHCNKNCKGSDWENFIGDFSDDWYDEHHDKDFCEDTCKYVNVTYVCLNGKKAGKLYDIAALPLHKKHC